MEAGKTLFADEGFARTGVRELCRAAKVSERAFYEVAGSREALLRAVYLQATRDVIADIESALEQAPADMPGRLRAGLGAFFGSIERDPRRGRLIYVESLGRGPEIEATRREGLALFVDQVERHLGGFLPDPAPPESTIDAIVTAAIMAIGEIAYRLTDGDPGFDGEQATEYLARALLGAGAAFGLRTY